MVGPDQSRADRPRPGRQGRRREAAARAIPVTDAEIALYGAGHDDPGTQLDEAIAKDALRQHAAEQQADSAVHETSDEYCARIQSYSRWQPETHPEANLEPETSPEPHFS